MCNPQLHDHVVVWNRAKSKSDGQWRTLDSRGLYKSVVTLGVMHEGVLSDLLTEALGVGWEQQTTRGGMVKSEIAGVPAALMREFSQRREVIEEWRAGLVATFLTEHGGSRPRSSLCGLIKRRTWLRGRIRGTGAWPK